MDSGAPIFDLVYNIGTDAYDDVKLAIDRLWDTLNDELANGKNKDLALQKPYPVQVFSLFLLFRFHLLQYQSNP